eukprot:SAG11_NODE_1916_length_4071_cov_3.418429_6_plen_145_part_00
MGVWLKWKGAANQQGAAAAAAAYLWRSPIDTLYKRQLVNEPTSAHPVFLLLSVHPCVPSPSRPPPVFLLLSARASPVTSGVPTGRLVQGWRSADTPLWCLDRFITSPRGLRAIAVGAGTWAMYDGSMMALRRYHFIANEQSAKE